MTKEIKLIRNAMVPKKAKNVDEAIMKISEWETNMAALQKSDSTLILKPVFKVALLTEICPRDTGPDFPERGRAQRLEGHVPDHPR